MKYTDYYETLQCQFAVKIIIQSFSISLDLKQKNSLLCHSMHFGLATTPAHLPASSYHYPSSFVTFSSDFHTFLSYILGNFVTKSCTSILHYNPRMQCI